MAVTDLLLAAALVLWPLLGLPLPGVVVDNLAQIVSLTTTTLSLTDQGTDALTNPNPLPILPAGSYDFIIVGGGSAGLIVANILSSNPAFTVLVLEAGGNPTKLHSIPGFMPYNVNYNETDWKYETEALNGSCLACPNNKVVVNAGKVLGGSSELNYMMYQRGNPNDYDGWADVTGDNGWSFAQVLPYFKKMETYQGQYPNALYHGNSGPLTISSQNYDGVMIQTWLNAGNEKGIPSSDPNGLQNQTFAPLEFLMKDGARRESYEAYLQPVLGRSNLKVIRYAKVAKVNINPTTKAVQGVTYTRLGQTITVTANKEVILSAGTIGTPQLLMLSGIGPSSHLSSLGIPVISNLPGVGANLQDHVLAMVGPFILNDTVSYLPTRDVTVGDAGLYVTNGTGPFAAPLCPGTGMGLISTSGNPSSWPNLLLAHAPAGVYRGWDRDIAYLFGIRQDILAQYIQGYVESDASIAGLALVRPKSRGTVKLASSNHNVKPLVDLNYYSEPEDLQAMIEGMRFLVNLFENTTAFQKYNASLIGNKFPGCESEVWKSDAYYECYLRHWTGTMWHLTGTARMGRANDSMAVVDSTLKVLGGIQGLRVIDASVIPNVTNTNTFMPTAMIAEKGGEIILNQYV